MLKISGALMLLALTSSSPRLKATIDTHTVMLPGGWVSNQFRPVEISSLCDQGNLIYVAITGNGDASSVAMWVIPGGCEAPKPPTPKQPCKNKAGAMIPCPEAQ